MHLIWLSVDFFRKLQCLGRLFHKLQRGTVAVMMATLVASFTMGIDKVRAGLLEGFEAGIPAGWIISPGGVCGTQGTPLPFPGSTDPPPQGVAFGFCDTTGGTPTGFTGVASTAGSWLLSPPFATVAGDTVSVDLNFLTNDNLAPFSDYAIAYLLPAPVVPPPPLPPVAATLYTAQALGAAPAVPASGSAAGLISPGVTLIPPLAFFDVLVNGPIGGLVYGPIAFGGVPGGSSGWVTTQFSPVPGAYQLLFVVSDVGDTIVDSALAIDNIHVTHLLQSVGSAQFTLRQENPGVADDQFVETAVFMLGPGEVINPAIDPVEIELVEPLCGGTFSRLPIAPGSFKARSGGKIFHFDGVVVDAVTGVPVTAEVRITLQAIEDYKVTMNFKDADYTCLEGAGNRKVTTIVRVGNEKMRGDQCFERLPDGDLFWPPSPGVVCP